MAKRRTKKGKQEKRSRRSKKASNKPVENEKIMCVLCQEHVERRNAHSMTREKCRRMRCARRYGVCEKWFISIPKSICWICKAHYYRANDLLPSLPINIGPTVPRPKDDEDDERSLEQKNLDALAQARISIDQKFEKMRKGVVPPKPVEPEITVGQRLSIADIVPKPDVERSAPPSPREENPAIVEKVKPNDVAECAGDTEMPSSSVELPADSLKPSGMEQCANSSFTKSKLLLKPPRYHIQRIPHRVSPPSASPPSSQPATVEGDVKPSAAMLRKVIMKPRPNTMDISMAEAIQMCANIGSAPDRRRTLTLRRPCHFDVGIAANTPFSRLYSDVQFPFPVPALQPFQQVLLPHQNSFPLDLQIKQEPFVSDKSPMPQMPAPARTLPPPTLVRNPPQPRRVIRNIILKPTQAR